ncbi:cytochrome p450 [Arabidopsis thaliana]|jgi:cytochrome P450 family 82 subfamily G polypeptide 1|uniref:Dimethylnonatriene synthase n=1 Tax=Arabidopsis thaliana TaxID=3702 RepID=C82G1_ARATH|nr:cytochrome P450, family 82, subfamily G, polypeptide 1 [Arabidopsis thaliana]Q9LSF8.1 RecName: Full=Dimethylnonatriene synthase; AltName: Full=Cytochrome P450 82G1; AltName: Full=Protein OVIPOSITION RATE 9; AltName: Full=Trimethyltridecatetraene synthase [Arabidopsis thaliana]AEE76989.1 cytochrome P450, family 82, subfamily G, polypeptide 1 [Arabidopsis thaliana]BAB02077.1 cytochrome p450 [Arabidopsis thaliana]|eukprot:NP_189154.1 cytochrome P450, family 82, subfamily G, polypeptide 1 [Arabidopsis thaliana]
MTFLFSTLQLSLFSLALVIFGYIFLRKQLSRCEVDSSTIPEPLGALPLFGHLHLLRGKKLLCKKLAAMSQKHGPIFSLKLGFYRLVVASDPKTVKDCFTTNDLATATRPNIAFGRYVGYNNASLTLAPYGDYWRELRKIVTVHLFSNHSIEMLGHIRSSEVNTLIKHLYKGNGGTSIVKIDMLFEFLTFNIILRKMVGKRIGFGEVNSDEWRYKEALKHCEYLAVIPMIGDVIPWLGWLDFAKNSQMKRLFKELDSVNTKWLHEHLKKRSRNEKDQERTIMDLLLDILPEDIVISGHVRDVIVKATILALTLTGSDSTSITLTWAVSLLLNNPAALEAAQEEIDNSVGKGRWIEESDIQNLKYLQAIVKETHRLYPPAPLTGIREAREDCFVGGYRVEKGTRLLVNIWKLHRDPKIWPDPKTFKPERFMEDKSQCEKSNFEYIPFGSGRRSCPGVNLGLRVVHFVLARLLQGFELHKVSDEPLDMAEGPGLALPKINPVEVVVMPRLDPKLYSLL